MRCKQVDLPEWLTQTADDLPRFMLLFVHGAKAVNEFIILSGFVIAHLVLSRTRIRRRSIRNYLPPTRFHH